MSFSTAITLLSCVTLFIPVILGSDAGCYHDLIRRANSTETEGQIWSGIVPGKDLAWHPCYSEPFECARLQVPLDYSNPNGRQAAIALIRKPATTQEDYRGPVLFNPGGPGGSGIDIVLSLGDYFATVIGPQFDIVSFDPRGVGRSTPRATYFDTDAERVLFGAATGPLPVVRDGSVSGIQRTWAYSRLLGSLAASHDDGYLGHITTENTATDMLRIVEAHGQQKIQYWGFSYGSVLGATFAAMYPDKIERLIIDGVVDADDYYSTGWLTSLTDSEKTLNLFFDKCAEAGPADCPLYSPNPAEIRANLTALQDRLLEQPITVKTDEFYAVVDYSTLRLMLFRSLYGPVQYFKPLATALAQLGSGNGTALASLMGQPAPYTCDCDQHAHDWDPVAEGFSTVACNDGAEIPGSLKELQDYWAELATVSQFADYWGTIRAGCVNWPKNKKPFRGPFVANTSHPILLIGNTADPVTPLASARKMAQGFQNSIVLAIDAGGHCSFNVPSVCAQMYVRQYFQNGTLPPADTVCDPIIGNPFLAPPSTQGTTVVGRASQDGESGDAMLRRAILKAAEKFQPFYLPASSRFGI